MDRVTRLALNRINQRFYASIADEWSVKRRLAWPGFERVVQRLPSRTHDGPATRVLDVGCGDGRFGQFLAERSAAGALIHDITYLGTDVSEALLTRARLRALPPSYHFKQADFVEASIADSLGDQRFDLIGLFGVLHHIPGHTERAELLRALAERVGDFGRLAFTVWRLDEDRRFATHRIPFEAYNSTVLEPITLDQLDPGDTLLRWGSGDAPPRYCHFPSAQELDALIQATGLAVCDRFRADGHLGRMNEYVVLGPR
jgi:SAM-dependent methyltransferase